MKKNLSALLLFLTFLLPSFVLAQTSVKINSKERKIVENITAAQLKDYLYYVASDEMGGRDTPSNGLDLTAKFIGTMLSRWNFKPAGDNGTFYQKIDLRRDVINPAGTNVSLNGQNLVYGTDFLANASVGTISNAPLVFGGNGWMVKSKNLEPLKDVDAKGKIVVIYADNFPRGVSFQEMLASGKRGEAWADPVTYAKQNGAVGVIIAATPSLEKNWEAIRRQRERGNFFVDKLRENSNGADFPTVYISSKAAENLFKNESSDLSKITEIYNSTESMPSFNFSSGNSVTINVTTTTEKATTQNVVAIWEGSDAVLKTEYVAIGAHYDHVGTNPNAKGDDKIFNGADDDGSGTVSVLSIAEALSKAPKRPKRSTLFVWHCGEEKGLWGSEYFNKFPTVNIKNVVTQLNIDMIGRSRKTDDTNPKNKDLSGENSVYVIGSEMMSSTLGAITKGTNDAYLKLGYDLRYDDPKDTNRFFFRSDHFNYAVNGIPIVFWFDGVHEDYHQPGDEPQKIDYAKMEKIARTICLTLLEISNLKERPKIDKQLPPELSVK